MFPWSPQEMQFTVIQTAASDQIDCLKKTTEVHPLTTQCIQRQNLESVGDPVQGHGKWSLAPSPAHPVVLHPQH